MAGAQLHGSSAGLTQDVSYGCCQMTSGSWNNLNSSTDRSGSAVGMAWRLESLSLSLFLSLSLSTRLVWTFLHGSWVPRMSPMSKDFLKSPVYIVLVRIPLAKPRVNVGGDHIVITTKRCESNILGSMMPYQKETLFVSSYQTCTYRIYWKWGWM